jgi:AraC-like DNA-binding protein
MPWASALVSSINEELKSNFLGVQLARSEFEKFIILLLREILNKNDKSLLDNAKKSSNGLYDDNKVLRNEKIDNFFNRSYYLQSITIENLAEELNLSVRQVNRILKEDFNTSFHAKLIERRLFHGKKNLLRSDKTVEDIAIKVGFSSSSGFYIAFKKEFGMTPLEFRRLYRK